MLLVTKSELADRAQVSRPAVTKAIKGELAGSVVDGKIDASHPAVTQYVARNLRRADRRRAPAPRGERTEELAPSVDTDTPPGDVQKILNGLPKDIRELADWSLRKLTEKFGTDRSMAEYLKAVRVLEKVHEQRLKNARDEGTVVSRDLVQRGVLEPFDLCFQRLLADGARAIATRVADMARAGESNEACEAFVSERLTDFIKGTKAAAGRALEPGA